MYNFSLNDPFFDRRIISTILRCKDEAEFSIGSFGSFENTMSDKMRKEFNRLNFNSSYYLDVESVSIESPGDPFSNHNYNKLLTGLGMVTMGQPILKKRFVMKGSSKGTSIASKYLSRAFPQRMPFRFLRTNVLGRMLGRAVPYIGTALI